MQKESLREQAVPFVSQMLGLVPEAESLARSALAFRLCCSVSEKEGRHLGGWAVSKGWGWGWGLHRQTWEIIIVLSR